MTLASILTPIEDFLSDVLVWFHESAGLTWAWAIVVLVALIRIVILPLTIKQETPGSSVVDKTKTLEYPAGFAAGLQFPLGGRARVVGQYRRSE